MARLQNNLATVLAADASKIVAIQAPGAGTYGHNGHDDATYDAALLARAIPDRTIRLQWPRDDDCSLEPTGPGAIVTPKAKLDDDGRIDSTNEQSDRHPECSFAPAGAAPQT